jgi:hypothetical protein
VQPHIAPEDVKIGKDSKRTRLKRSPRPETADSNCDDGPKHHDEPTPSTKPKAKKNDKTVKPASRASSKMNSNKSAMNDTFDLDSSLEDDLTLPPTNLKKTKGKATKPNSTVSSKVPSTYRNIVKSSAESSSDSPNSSPIRRNKGRTLKNTVKVAVNGRR